MFSATKPRHKTTKPLRKFICKLDNFDRETHWKRRLFPFTLFTNHCAVLCHAEWSGVVTCFAGGKPIICLFSHCISRRRRQSSRRDGRAKTRTRGMQCSVSAGRSHMRSSLPPGTTDRPTDMHKTGRWNMEGGGRRHAAAPEVSPLLPSQEIR